MWYSSRPVAHLRVSAQLAEKAALSDSDSNLALRLVTFLDQLGGSKSRSRSSVMYLLTFYISARAF